MKYEGQHYSNTPEEAPNWFRNFLSHYAMVIRFLTEFNINKFTMGDDVNLGPVNRKVNVRHGVVTSIPHNLSIAPTRAIFSGRVEATNLLDIDSKVVRVVAKLLSTRVIAITNTSTVQVEDSTLFRVGDEVKIGPDPYRISSIEGNLVTFASALPRATIYCMTLSQDAIDVTIF